MTELRAGLPVMLAVAMALSAGAAHAQTENHAPVCRTKTLPVAEGTSVDAFEFNPISLAQACIDPDGDVLTLTSVTTPGVQLSDTNGTLRNAIKLNDTLSDNGELTIGFMVSDGHGGETAGTVIIVRDIPQN